MAMSPNAFTSGFNTLLSLVILISDFGSGAAGDRFAHQWLINLKSFAFNPSTLEFKSDCLKSFDLNSSSGEHHSLNNNDFTLSDPHEPYIFQCVRDCTFEHFKLPNKNIF